MKPEYISIPILLIIAAFAFYMAYWKYNHDKHLSDDVVKNHEEKNKLIADILPDLIRQYKAKKSVLNIPNNCERIGVETTVFGIPYKAIPPAGKRDLLDKSFYCWNDNKTLYIFPTEDHLQVKHIDSRTTPDQLDTLIDINDIPLFVIPFNSIDYYTSFGKEKSFTSIQTENTGVNVKGAIVGGLLAGEAGAIIGSQQNRNRVHSTTRIFDERCVSLYYTINGQTSKIKLSLEVYPLFEKWFPEKEYEYVMSHIDKGQDQDDPFDTIKKYKNLLDEGIITQEEFDTKKGELLSLI